MKQGGAECSGHSVEQAAIFDPVEIRGGRAWMGVIWIWGTLLI